MATTTTTGERVTGMAGAWSEKGYCFVTLATGERVFVHVTDCPHEEPLAAGQVVKMAVTRSPKGLRGHSISLVDAAQE
jgi:cold shock CspA family protein